MRIFGDVKIPCVRHAETEVTGAGGADGVGGSSLVDGTDEVGGLLLVDGRDEVGGLLFVDGTD